MQQLKSGTYDPAFLALAEKRIQSVRRFIIRHEAFFSTVMLDLKQVWCDLGTCGTDGEYLYLDPKFITDCTHDKASFVMLHEILHVILKTHLRRGNRDKRIWNNAADFVINALIVRMGLHRNYHLDNDDNFRKATRERILRAASIRGEYTMPNDGLFEPKYLGMTHVEVYDLLTKEEAQKPKGEGQGQGQGQGQGSGDGQDQGAEKNDREEEEEQAAGGGEEESDEEESDEEEEQAASAGDDGEEEGQIVGEGEGGDCPWGIVLDATKEDGTKPSPKELADAERVLNQTLETAANIAKGRGQMPGFLEEAIDINDKPSQDWQDHIRETLADTLPNDFTYERPNRFHLGNEMIMPSLDNEGIGHLAIFTDASGSVSQNEFKQFMTDTWEICTELLPSKVTLIQFDSRAEEPEELEFGDEPELKRRRSGGTVFSAPFHKADDAGMLEDFDAIIVFTDGGDNTWPEEPRCPVIWATTGAFWGGDPPFGELVQVKFPE